MTEAVERRAGSVIVVPGGIGEQILREPAARAEAAGGIVRHKRAGVPAEELGEEADLVKDGRRSGIEGRGPGEQRQALRLGQPVHPVLLNLGAEDHEQRAIIADRLLQWIEQSVGSALQRSDGPQRCVNHQRVAGA